MLQEFKDFVNKGNIVDLAVAVVMATAFKPIIDAFVKGVMMQIVSAIFDQPSFDGLTIDLAGTPIFYGTVITTTISFVMVAIAVFFVLKAYNAAQNQGTKDEADVESAEDAPTGPSEIDLLTEIRDSLRSR